MHKLTEFQRNKLLTNPHVSKVGQARLTYTSGFKIHCLAQSKLGKSSDEIFKAAGIDLSLFAIGYAAGLIKKWKRLSMARGKKDFAKDMRGIGSKGRTPRKFDPNDIDSLRAELALVKAERDFLKKLHALAEEMDREDGLI